MQRLSKSLSTPVKWFLVGFFCLIALPVIWFGGGGLAFETYSLKKQGFHVRDQIEDYRKAHGRIPPNLTTLGIEETEAGPIYYIPSGNSEYKLYFGMPGTVGESITYSSGTQKWDY